MSTVGYFNSAVDPVVQLDAFNSQKCDYIYHDEAGLFQNAQAGDVVVFHDLSDAGADLEAALGFIHRLNEHELGFVFVEDGLDTRSSGDLGSVMEAMYKLVQAQAKRSRPRTRTARTSDSAGRGEGGGRGRAPIAPEVIDEALSRYAQGDTVHSICEELGLSQGTLYRYIRERGVTRNKGQVEESA